MFNIRMSGNTPGQTCRAFINNNILNTNRYMIKTKLTADIYLSIIIFNKILLKFMFIVCVYAVLEHRNTTDESSAQHPIHVYCLCLCCIGASKHNRWIICATSNTCLLFVFMLYWSIETQPMNHLRNIQSAHIIFSSIGFYINCNLTPCPALFCDALQPAYLSFFLHPVLLCCVMPCSLTT